MTDPAPIGSLTPNTPPKATTDPTKTTEPTKTFAKSAAIIEALKQSNPGIYRLMTDDSVINGMGKALLTNPAYSGQTGEQMKRALLYGEQIFAQGLMTSPTAQNLYMQSLQTLMKEQGPNGPLAKGQMNGPFGLPGLSGLDVLNSSMYSNTTKSFLNPKKTGTGTDTGTGTGADTNFTEFTRKFTTSGFDPLRPK